MLTETEIRFILSCIKLSDGVESILTHNTIQRAKSHIGYSPTHGPLEHKLSMMLDQTHSAVEN